MKFRIAQGTDFDAVMAIGDVYSGLDYMEQGYHKMIKDQRYFPVVCTIEGPAVGIVLLLKRGLGYFVLPCNLG